MKATDLLHRYGVLIAFLAIFIVSALTSDDFLKPENLRNILYANSAIGVIAVGMTLVILAGGIDLSVGSLMALAAGIGLEVFNRMNEAGQGAVTLIAVCAALGAGGLLGLVNGLLVTVGRITPFIATLAGLIMYRSLVLELADGGEIRGPSSPEPRAFEWLSGGINLPGMDVAPGIPLTLYWGIVQFFLVAAVIWFLLDRTRLGRHIVAVGSNEVAARYSAINTRQVKLWTYSILGLCCGIAALIETARMNSVSSSQLGLLYELDAIAAVVIGGTTLSGGRGTVWGTVVGVVMLGMITNMLVMNDVSPYWQGFAKGLIILVAVWLQRGRHE